MTSEQAFQARKNAASNSVSRYGGTTWAAGSGSVDLEIEAEDEPPGAARLNPGDTSYTHVGDNNNNNTATTSDSEPPQSAIATTAATVSHANDHATQDNTTIDGASSVPSTITTTDTSATTTSTTASATATATATAYAPIEGSRVPTELLSGLDPIVADRVGVSVSWVNPKLRACTSTTGSGMFAIQHIQKGEHLIVWTGKIVTAEEALAVMDTEDKHYLLQIGEGFYQTPLSSYREPADYTNHSCEPTAGFGKGSPICLSAMCDIPVGGQVLFDYGMCETDPRLWEPMECLCGTPSCRKWITANDWYLYPELWERYAGYWAPHVQRKIDTYRAELEAKKKIEKSTSTHVSLRRPSSQILSLPPIDIFDSPAFTPMQVSSSSPSSSGSTSPISTPSSSPPSSPTHTTSMEMLSTDIQPSSRLSQAKAKAKAKLAKQAEKEKSNVVTKKVKSIQLISESSSSSSGDESDVGDERVLSESTSKVEYVETISQQPFYITMMDRVLAMVGLQRIAAASSSK